MSATWGDVHARLKAALDDFVRGDATTYKAMWSTVADISVMGAFGGIVIGQAEDRDRLDRAAAAYRNGSYEAFEIVGEAVGADMAYLAWTERIRSFGEDGAEVTRARRATQVFRRESEGWRIVHQHSDPLVELELPT
jgi:ketosteroid isomerase-like protein